ncbi:uncharacterized protein [Dermacentor albipictus]|uniref:uncharacterized protein n=1 Tax=Dermacentor albipictus TaxID=60249 RepID=UPI0031FBD684
MVAHAPDSVAGPNTELTMFKRREEVVSAEDSSRSFFVRYLGCTRFQSKSKQRGLKALQQPLLDLYSAARRKGESQRSVHPLALTQRLDVSHYGLVVAEALEDPETRRAVTAVTRVITPAANIVLWAALRFSARLAKRRSIGAAFVPLACSEDVVDRSWYLGLSAKRRFLVGLAHPPVFACLFRQVAAPSTWECHGFICASAEDALMICSSLGEARDTVVVLDRPRPTPVVVAGGKRPDDYSDLTSITASSYTVRNASSRKLTSSIDEPQSSVTASASGYYQEVVDRRFKSPRRSSKRVSRRTDTESKSSASEERKRRVRRKSNSYKYRDLSKKYAGAALSRPITSELSYSSAGNVTVTTEDTLVKDVILQTTGHKDGLIFQNVVPASNSGGGGPQESFDESSSSAQTPTNDTGYFSSKSKSAKASKEDLTQEEAPAAPAAPPEPPPPPRPPQSTYYFGQNVAPAAITMQKTNVTSYTYFLKDSARIPVKEPVILPEQVKPRETNTTSAVTTIVPPSGTSDSSLSGYHSDSCCQTREAGTMTKDDECCDSDCCCSCDFSSACSECSSSRRTLVPSGRCQSRGQMTISETMNFSSECDSEAHWLRRSSVAHSFSTDGRVKGRAENGHEHVTRAQVHHHHHERSQHVQQQQQRNFTAVKYHREQKEQKQQPDAQGKTMKNAFTSTTASLCGDSPPNGKVVIDVAQCDGISRGVMTPGIISFNKHGHVRDWASLSNCSGSSRVTTTTLQPVQQRPQRTAKVIRWEQQPQLSKRKSKPGFLSNLKTSLTRARLKTGKLFSRMRSHRNGKEVATTTTVHDPDAASQDEVCLSPDGNVRPKRKRRRRLSWSFHDLRSAFPSKNNGATGNAPQRPRRRKKKSRNGRGNGGAGGSDVSDSFLEEEEDRIADAPTSPPRRPRRKSDSELGAAAAGGQQQRRVAGDVTTIRVEHGLTKEGFTRWSNTNLHSELGYIP